MSEHLTIRFCNTHDTATMEGGVCYQTCGVLVEVTADE